MLDMPHSSFWEGDEEVRCSSMRAVRPYNYAYTTRRRKRSAFKTTNTEQFVFLHELGGAVDISHSAYTSCVGVLQYG
jgi:hypothetical protein